jgi:hypothetical protein
LNCGVYIKLSGKKENRIWNWGLNMKRRSKIISPLIILGILAGIRWFNLSRDRNAKVERPQSIKTRPATDSLLKDDLTEIEGIGPKSTSALNRAGIYTFQQLAE